MKPKEILEPKCPYLNKAFLLPNGQIIQSPCCKSPYCKRCSWYRKWKIHEVAPHTCFVLHCYQTFLVLPYYKPVPRRTKKTINEYFWRGLRARFGPLAYIHTLEMQHGLLHGNWHLLTDKQVEKEFVLLRWGNALLRHANITFQKHEGYCDAIINPKKVTEYVLKYYEKNPEDYLPRKGIYRKIMYMSQNYNQYVTERCDDALIAKICEEVP